MTKKVSGFTLIEMLLVMVIVSAIVLMTTGYFQERTRTNRTDLAALQLQQLLNASMSFYVAWGKWPGSPNPGVNAIQCLSGTMASPCNQAYLPSSIMAMTSPYGTFWTASTYGTRNIYFALQITGANASADATIIAGKLPLSYVTGNSPAGGVAPAPGPCGATCYVVTMVNIPGQNLNNATAMNFAGLYKHGGCVPAPACPVDGSGTTMTPQVFIVPVSISGLFGNGNNSNVYPISSFTGYATGNGTTTTPGYCNGGSGGSVTGTTDCTVGGAADNNGPTVTGYWRACVQIVTAAGSMQARTDNWGNNVTVAAFTRCAINNEPAGSTFNVYGN